MPTAIARLLDAPAFWLFARILVTFPFWGSGLSKLLMFQEGVAEMRHFGLEPAEVYNIAVATTQLVGSALVISNRLVWLGAGALGVFTALTIPIAHRFWEMTGPMAQIEFFFTVEHVGLIAGLILVSILSRREAPVPVAAPLPA